jgi:prepilin-type N-terminal cleavage/methylation domain-containing protein
MRRPASGRTYPAAFRARRRGDAAFTLIELIVAMAIMAIAIGLTVGFIIGLQQQQVNVDATVSGAREAQLASQEVVQYLRAAATPVGLAETATQASFPAYIGSGTSGGPPATVQITVSYISGTGVGTGIAGEGRLQVTFQGSSSSRVATTYYVLAPNASTPIFTYERYNPSAPGQLQAMAAPIPATDQCALNQIVAIVFDVSFFAGPPDAQSRGYALDTASTDDTTIYLRNTGSVYGSTTTTWVPPTGGCVL